MNDLLAILLIVLGFLALLFACVLVCAGAMFLRMCGSYASCERIYRTWCEERDRETDEQIRAGFKQARALGWLPEKFL